MCAYYNIIHLSLQVISKNERDGLKWKIQCFVINVRKQQVAAAVQKWEYVEKRQKQVIYRIY